MADKDRNRNGDDWNYQSSLIDLRFLKAIDYITKKNKAAKVKPATDSSISKTIFGHKNAIREIRNFQRGVTLTELHKFAGYFHLDFNYFFRGTEPMTYNGRAGDHSRDISINGENIKNIDIISDTNGNVHNGDVYIIIEKVSL